ncbi:MAG: hypothetical protein DRQ48_06080 [Gammaproteobacteria bacterium]|nr:MAG: hypothetical protein DRQ48_06080 [Gammaproteobacteria bacterium]
MSLEQIYTSGTRMIGNRSVLLSGFILTLLLTTTGFAEDYDKGHGGDGFRETAMNYENRAKKYEEKGFSDIAYIYTRMAEIKRHAGNLADQGRWDDIDWSEYEELDEKLTKIYESMKHKK